MSYEMTGTVKVVMDLITFDSGFTKREFVVTTRDQWPQDVKFETVKDKTAILDNLEPGQEVTVHFDIRGNEWKDKYFVNLSAWRIQTDAQAPAGGAPSGAPGKSEVPPLDTDAPDSVEDEDYPF
ncbi:MAG: DUF3127 domain-containing protein [Verrucomicrobia bacterium]|nr:DUF3127 domain-containing protein [Verrucomicrobiota bacterium]MCH8512784.1 DUF3127 domain-containing protein [Kiritimatiellia bacterium]